MTEFENKVLQWLEQSNQRFDRLDQRFDRLEQRIGRVEKSVAILSDAVPKLVIMVDALHTDYLVRNGLIAKEE